MYCSNCGNKMNDDAKFCPNCGAPSAAVHGEIKTEGQVKIIVSQQPSVVKTAETKPVVTEKINRIGVAGFVLGILSTTFGFTVVLPILAFIFGLIGTCTIKKYNTSNGLAIAGLTLSIIDICIWFPLLKNFFAMVFGL